MKTHRQLLFIFMLSLFAINAFAVGKAVDIWMTTGKSGGKIQQAKPNMYYFFDTNGKQFAYAIYRPVKSYLKQDKDTVVNTMVQPFSYFDNGHRPLGYVRVVNGLWYLYSPEWKLLGNTNEKL